MLILNAFDAVATLTWIRAGVAHEANPIMAAALDIHPALFVLAKIALVDAAVLLLDRLHERRLVRWLTPALLMLYTYVAGGHVGFWLGLSLGWIPPELLELSVP